MSVTSSQSMGRVGNVSHSSLVEETRRRQIATVTGGASTLENDPEYNRPFQSDDQRVVLYNIANTDNRPRSLRPALRILGLFPSLDEASAHGREILRDDPENPCALRIGDSHAWYVISSSFYTDIEPYRLKVNRNLKEHDRRLEGFAEEFKKRKEHLTKGRTPVHNDMVAAERAQARRMELQDERLRAMDADAVDAQMAREAEQARAETREMMSELDQANERIRRNEARAAALAQAEQDGFEESKGGEAGNDEFTEGTDYVETPLVAPEPPEKQDETWEQQVRAAWPAGGRAVPSLKRHLEVRRQNFAVISVVQDYEEGKEPGFIVWGAFDSEQEAKKYELNVAAKKVTNHDIAIVNMYEWVYPHLMNSDRVEQLYRNQELNNIMRQARTRAKQVDDFKEQCETEGIDLPVTEIAPDLDRRVPLGRASSRPLPAGFDPVDASLSTTEGDGIEEVGVPADRDQ